MDMLLKDVADEITIARKRFPFFHSKHEGYAVVLEEVRELEETIFKHETDEQVYEEGIQVIAMVICLLLETIPLDKQVMSKRR